MRRSELFEESSIWLAYLPGSRGLNFISSSVLWPGASRWGKLLTQVKGPLTGRQPYSTMGALPSLLTVTRAVALEGVRRARDWRGVRRRREAYATDRCHHRARRRNVAGDGSRLRRQPSHDDARPRLARRSVFETRSASPDVWSSSLETTTRSTRSESSWTSVSSSSCKPFRRPSRGSPFLLYMWYCAPRHREMFS